MSISLRSSWFPSWGVPKKKNDYNAFLVSKAKQLKQEEELEQQHKWQRKQLQKLDQEQQQQEQQCNQQQNDETRFSARNNIVSKRPTWSLVRRASVRAHSLTSSFAIATSQPRSFSLVLTEEDLKGLELQRKLESLRRQGEKKQQSNLQELQNLKQTLDQSRKEVATRLNLGIDLKEYLDVVQKNISLRGTKNEETEEEGNDDESGNVVEDRSFVEGQLEAELMKALHKADMQERMRKMQQEQTNEEILRFYKMESIVKEDFAEREAKILSMIAMIDAILGKLRQCHQDRAKICEKMVLCYEKAAKMHVDRMYRALTDKSRDDNRSSSDESKNDKHEQEEKELTQRRLKTSQERSYSARILAVHKQEKEENTTRGMSLMQPTLAAEDKITEEHRSADESFNQEQRHEIEDKKNILDNLITCDHDESVVEGNEKENIQELVKSEVCSSSPENVRPTSTDAGHNGSDSNSTSTPIPSFARSAGASRNTRISTARPSALAHRDVCVPSSSSATSTTRRPSAIVTRPRVTTGISSRTGLASKSALSSTAAMRMSTRPSVRASNIAPRRVNSATARK